MSEAYEPGTIIKNDYGIYRVIEAKPYSGSIYYDVEKISGDEPVYHQLTPEHVERAEVGECTDCGAEFYERDDYYCESCRDMLEATYFAEQTALALEVNEAWDKALLENMRLDAMHNGYEKAIRMG